MYRTVRQGHETQKKILASNAPLLLDLALEAFAEMERCVARSVRPQPVNDDGDFEDFRLQALKKALTTIVVASLYFEALLFLVARYGGLGATRANDMSMMTFAHRLEAIGITDHALLLAAENLRNTRLKLIEKVNLPDEVPVWTTSVLQDAREAISFVKQIQMLSQDVFA